MSQLELSVIIPAYKEEDNLRVLLPRLHSVLRTQAISYEIIVVDSMEPLDGSRQVCLDNATRYINRRGGNNYGDAVRTGIEAAGGSYILFMDGDGSHTPEFAPRLILEREPDSIVIASRYVKGGSTENSVSLMLMSKALNFLYALILGLNCKDVSNSFKLYPAALIKPMHLRSSNFDIIEEILYKLKRDIRGLAIKEIPFDFKKRMFGSTKRNLLVFMVSYFFTLLKLRFGK